jgi:hypothetical protein
MLLLKLGRGSIILVQHNRPITGKSLAKIFWAKAHYAEFQ